MTHIHNKIIEQKQELREETREHATPKYKKEN